MFAFVVQTLYSRIFSSSLDIKFTFDLMVAVTLSLVFKLSNSEVKKSKIMGSRCALYSFNKMEGNGLSVEIPLSSYFERADACCIRRSDRESLISSFLEVLTNFIESLIIRTRCSTSITTIGSQLLQSPFFVTVRNMPDRPQCLHAAILLEAYLPSREFSYSFSNLSN